MPSFALLNQNTTQSYNKFTHLWEYVLSSNVSEHQKTFIKN